MKYPVEVIRTKKAEEIAESYGIPLSSAQRVKGATKIQVYPFLVDKALTTGEKAELSNRSESTIRSYMSALRRTGFEDPITPTPRKSERKDLIFDVVDREPSTLQEIFDALKPKNPDISFDSVQYHSYNMLRDRTFGKVKLDLKLNTSSPFSDHELLGDLAGRMMLYVLNIEGENKLGNKIARNLPPKEKITRGMKKCITHVLKPPKTPKISFDVIRKYTHGY